MIEVVIVTIDVVRIVAVVMIRGAESIYAPNFSSCRLLVIQSIYDSNYIYNHNLLMAQRTSKITKKYLDNHPNL